MENVRQQRPAIFAHYRRSGTTAYHRPQGIFRGRQPRKLAISAARRVSRQPSHRGAAIDSDSAIAPPRNWGILVDRPPAIVVRQIPPQPAGTLGTLIGGRAQPPGAKLLKAVHLPNGREHAATLWHLDRGLLREGSRGECHGDQRQDGCDGSHYCKLRSSTRRQRAALPSAVDGFKVAFLPRRSRCRRRFSATVADWPPAVLGACYPPPRMLCQPRAARKCDFLNKRR